MAEDTPGLAAELLAAIGGTSGAASIEPIETTAAGTAPVAVPAAQDEPNASLKRERTEEATEDAPAEKRQRTDPGGEALGEPEAPSASFDISAMLQNAFASLDEEQYDRATPVDGEARSLPPPAISPITPPGPTDRTIQNQIKFSNNPFHVMRSMSLPLLGNVAVQILLALSQQPRAETSKLLSNSESDYRRVFDLLKASFDAARKQFSETRQLLSPDELDIKDLEDRETIRIANLATSACCFFGEAGLPLEEIHEDALRIFVPEDGELTEEMAQMLLALKTHIALPSASGAEGSEGHEGRLEKYFSSEIKEALKRRNIFGGPLTAVEEGLVRDAKIRRGELQDAFGDTEKRELLSRRHSEEALVDLVGSYLQSHLVTVVDYAERYGINIPSVDDTLSNAPLGNLVLGQGNGLPATAGMVSLGTAPVQGGDEAVQHSTGVTVPMEDGLGLGILLQSSVAGEATPDLAQDSGANGTSLFESKGLASLIAEKLSALDGRPSSVHGAYSSTDHLGGLHSPHLSQLYQSYESAYQPYQDAGMPQPAQAGGDGDHLPPHQSFPTSVLYERARQAAVAKSSAHARREGIHSTRRPWSSEEEKALMAGLDMVKGPHWSQILTLFGPNGTISDILKDRTQVQLKDKARNLKLFFLKTNSEMPYYLQCVTGELKTRAPGQAARKEAEEKARMNSEEEQARLQGIMTLAGGLQNNNMTATSPARTGPLHPHVLAALQSRTLAPTVPSSGATQLPVTTTAAPPPAIRAQPPATQTPSSATPSLQLQAQAAAAAASQAVQQPPTAVAPAIVPARVPTPHNPNPGLPAATLTQGRVVAEPPQGEKGPTPSPPAEPEAPPLPVDVPRSAPTTPDAGQESSLVQALKAVVAGPLS